MITPEFQSVLDNLSSPDEPITANSVYWLSEIAPSNLARLRAAWLQWPAERRITLMRRLRDTSEVAFDLEFSGVALFALDDPEGEVRLAAIQTLWLDSSHQVFKRLMQMAQDDPYEATRAAALSALGRFIYEAELLELPETWGKKASDLAFSIHMDKAEPLEVRRRALEALSRGSHDAVTDLIKDAYASGQPLMQVSAIFAMGQSCDEIWGPILIAEAKHEEAARRYEAARSMGEIGYNPGVKALGELLKDEDREVQEVSIWALGQIGGDRAFQFLQRALLRAEQDEDEWMIELLEDAMASAMLFGGEMPF
jgi:HEAT repeat protein